jgi:predicted PurR-regulated permease PerM
MNKIVAIVITLFLTFIVLASLGTLIFSQVSRFGDSWPILVEKFTGVLNNSITWVSGYFSINPENIHEWVTKTQGELINGSGAAIGQTLVSLGSGVMNLLLIPIYVFLILFYEPLLLDFIHKLFSTESQKEVNEIINQIKTVIQHYLVGLVIEMIIVAILNITALLILGVDYAILLGIIGALLNLVPYVGGIIGAALPMMVALATKSTAWYAIYIMVIYTIIQLIDNNVIVPKVVASKVKINAIFSIIVVIAGNALWGVSGMFLSIPLLAIVKLIFDHIEPLKPWGFLLGDTMPPLLIIKPIFKKTVKKSL